MPFAVLFPRLQFAISAAGEIKKKIINRSVLDPHGHSPLFSPIAEFLFHEEFSQNSSAKFHSLFFISTRPSKERPFANFISTVINMKARNILTYKLERSLEKRGVEAEALRTALFIYFIYLYLYFYLCRHGFFVRASYENEKATMCERREKLEIF